MSTQTLMMAVLVALTVVALMIAINSRGRWRATLSSLLALCLLGGTTWVFILQYSIGINADVHGEPRSFPLRELVQRRDRSPETAVPPPAVPQISTVISQANEFAGSLLQEKLYDPIHTHDQLIARAANAEHRLELLQSEMNKRRSSIDSIPEAAQLLEFAMAELKAACHLYGRYYFAENTDAEVSIERLFRQKVRSARDSLLKAERVFATR